MTEPGAGREGCGADLLAIFADWETAVSTPGVGAVTAQLGFVSSSERSEPLGPGDSVVHSHWSRSSEARLSLVESFIVLLHQCLLCHKEPDPRVQSPLLGAFCLLLAGSLCHEDSWLPCTERICYRRPHAIKNQRKARNAPSRGHFVPKPLVGGFGCLELVLHGIRLLVEQHYEALDQSEQTIE